MRVAELGRGGRGGVAVEVEDDRPPAVQGEQPRRGPADAPCEAAPVMMQILSARSISAFPFSILQFT